MSRVPSEIEDKYLRKNGMFMGFDMWITKMGRKPMWVVTDFCFPDGFTNRDFAYILKELSKDVKRSPEQMFRMKENNPDRQPARKHAYLSEFEYRQNMKRAVEIPITLRATKHTDGRMTVYPSVSVPSDWSQDDTAAMFDACADGVRRKIKFDPKDLHGS